MKALLNYYFISINHIAASLFQVKYTRFPSATLESHKSRVAGENHLLQTASYTYFDEEWDMIGFLGCKTTMPAHVELFIHQYPQALLCRAIHHNLSFCLEQSKEASNLPSQCITGMKAGFAVSCCYQEVGLKATFLENIRCWVPKMATRTQSEWWWPLYRDRGAMQKRPTKSCWDSLSSAWEKCPSSLGTPWTKLLKVSACVHFYSKESKGSWLYDATRGSVFPPPWW